MAPGQSIGRRSGRGWVCALLAATTLWIAAPPGQAVNITLSYQSGDSAPPSWDPSGTALQDLMAAAEAIWEDIIEDSWTLEIEFYWSDLSGSTLGLHTNLLTDPWAGDRRPQKARIQLDSLDGGVDQGWYNDTTPFDHSEYDMVPHLVLDDPDDHYYSDPPELVEAGYRGAALGTAPLAAQNNPDLLSVCLHEMGHALGMTDRVADDDVGLYAYVFPADMVDHEYAGVDTYNTSDVYHIEPPDALMFPFSSAGMRTLPSATDVLAIARCSDWTSIDLPRQDLWNGYDMNAADSWEGNKLPDADDDAYVRFGIYNDPADSDTAYMTGAIHVENLYLTNGSSIDTNNQTLTVDDTIEINRAPTGGKPALIVDTGGMLNGTWVNINGGELRVTGGYVDVAGIETQPLNGSIPSITGYGTVETSWLDNDGEIRAFPGGLLRIEWRGSGAGLDLDGDSESGQINAWYGDVEIAGGGISESFSGTMMIGTTGNSTARYVNVTTDWELGFGAQLQLVGNSDGSFTRRAELRGGTMTVNGTVTASHYARIDAMTEFNGSSEIIIAENGTLYLGVSKTDSIEYHGVDITGLGTLVQNGDTLAGGGTVIDVASYDMDGTTISDMVCYGAVYVTSNELTDSYTGHLIVTGQLHMDLGVAATWVADTGSRITVGGGNGSIDGATKLMLQGILESNNDNKTGTINSAIDIASTATVDVRAANDVLDLAGPTTWSGPTSVTGGGTLAQTGDADVIADTTINTYYFDFDGSAASSETHIDQGVSFTINSQGLAKDTAGGRYEGTVYVNGGTLAVNTNGPWDLGGTMYLTETGGTPAVLDGQPVRVDGGLISVKGAATIDTTVTLVGSGLTVGGGSTLTHNGTLNVDGGELFVASAARMDANGNAYFRVGGTTHVDGELELNGPVSFYGGTFTGDGLIQLDTPSTIAALVLGPTTINVARFDLDGTSGNTRTELEDDLTLNVDGLDVSDSAFNGELTIYDDSTLTVHLPGGAAWPMMGDLKIFDPGGWGVVSLAGSTMNITGGGVVDVDAETRFDAKINVHSTGTVVLQDGATLALGGGALADANKMLGGQINNADDLNPGSLAAGTGKALTGYGTVNCDINFTGDSLLMADGGTLTLGGTLLDLGGKVGTADDDGTLNVVDPWNTALADSCELNGGRIEGAGINNDGKIVGHGVIASSGLTNNGHLIADGGTLVINTTNAPDIDGVGAEDGVIDATKGSIHVLYTGWGGYAFNGELLIGAGHFFRADSGTINNMPTAGNEGRITMTGGQFIADGLQQYSTLKILNAPSTLDADAKFASGSMTSLDDDLLLLHDSVVDAGAVISGTGTLINDTTGRVDLDDGSDIDAPVVNRGTLILGITPASPVAATASAKKFTQTTTGEISFDLLVDKYSSEHDQLMVGTETYLAGKLTLSVASTDYLAIGDAFTLIAAGNVNGNFNTVAGVPLGDIGGQAAAMAVLYHATSVMARVSLLADTDLNDTVDIADLQALAGNFGGDGSWVSGDFDGDGAITIADLQLMAGNFGSVASSPAAALNASVRAWVDIPEPTSLLVLAGGVPILLRRRR